jgi:hypothetical protein
MHCAPRITPTPSRPSTRHTHSRKWPIITASPLAAAALVLVSELYVVDVLGDESGRDVTTRK